MGKRRVTVAQALVLFLNQQYIQVDGEEIKFVEQFMGIFGHGNVVGLGEALHAYQDQIRFVQGKNEQDIANVCIAYAKQNKRRRICPCTSSIGPGALNMVTAAGTATVNRIPLLLLPGDAYADRQPDPVLQQVEDSRDSTISVNDAFKPVSKYWDRIVRPEQLMSACLNAMRVLTDPAETGAVVLCLPQDVQGEAYEYPEEFLEKRVWYLDRMPPAEEAIERAAICINTKQKPVIIAGGGVRYSDAGMAVLEFAKEFGIPIVETQAGKGEISFKEDYQLGCCGACGTLAANQIVRDADVILAVGTKLNDFVTSSKAAFAKSAPIIAINTAKMDSMKMDSLSVLADAKAGIVELHKVLRERQYQAGYGEEIQQAKQQWMAELEALAAPVKQDRVGTIDGMLNQTKVLLALNDLLEDDAIIVGAAGSLPSDLERIWRPKLPGTYHLEYGFSCMGYEISGALGAKLAAREQEVYAFVGDGSFLMAHSDLLTSLQEQVKINILLFHNHGHQCIHNLQKNQGIGSFGTEFRYREESTGALSGAYTTIQFAEVARAYGAESYRVTTMEELQSALADSKKSEKSTLIEIMVLPGTNTEGYESFWRVGLASVSDQESVRVCYQELKNKVDTLRKW